jgi:hypothetical protein
MIKVSIHRLSGRARHAALRERAILADFGLATVTPAGSVTGAFGRDAISFTMPPPTVPVRVYDRTTDSARWERAGFAETWTRKGLEALVQSAMEQLNSVHGIDLPWNLYKGPWQGLPYVCGERDAYHLRRPDLGPNEYATKAFRMAGWLRAVAAKPGQFPGIVKMLRATQSSRGQASPRTTVNLWDFVAKAASPHKAEKLLWAVRRRADAILTAYSGAPTIGWRDVAGGLLASCQVGKAAIVAVACRLLPQAHVSRYADARTQLAALHQATARDATDGVAVRYEERPCLDRLGVTVYAAFQADCYERFRPLYLVCSKSGWSYHSERHSPRAAMFDALDAWRRRAKAEADNSDDVGFLRGDRGYIPLVYRQDSYAAGNCGPGTEAWARDHGWHNRAWVPGPWLVPHMADPRVRRVVAAAARQATA